MDPFCGHGTTLAVANKMGMDAIGVERSIKRCRTSSVLNVEYNCSASNGGYHSEEVYTTVRKTGSGSVCLETVLDPYMSILVP
eukprot:5740663-Pyramimonas_sp.AAC.1